MSHELLESDAPWRCLWLSVILRAKQDAASENMMCGWEDLEFFPKEAREWLSKESWDLKKVCEWAGVEVREVLKVGRGMYEPTKVGTRWGADREVPVRESSGVRAEVEESGGDGEGGKHGM